MKNNVGTTERVVTGLVAAGIAAYAVKKVSSPTGRVVAGLTSALLGTRAAAGYCPAYDAAQLATSDESHTTSGRHAVRVEHSTTIDAPIEKVYAFWNDVENFPKFMSHLQSVERTGDKTSHWVSDGPLGTKVEWDSEEIKNVRNDVIAWRSTSGGVANAGSIRFRSAGPKTRVRVKLEYTPPAGQVGAAVAKFFGEDPKTQLKEYLTKLKAILGEGVPVEEAARQKVATA